MCVLFKYELCVVNVPHDVKSNYGVDSLTILMQHRATTTRHKAKPNPVEYTTTACTVCYYRNFMNDGDTMNFRSI
jgi:hypothetical protein